MSPRPLRRSAGPERIPAPARATTKSSRLGPDAASGDIRYSGGDGRVDVSRPADEQHPQIKRSPARTANGLRTLSGPRPAGLSKLARWSRRFAVYIPYLSELSLPSPKQTWLEIRPARKQLTPGLTRLIQTCLCVMVLLLRV